MKYSQPEKMEIIRMVKELNFSVRRTLRQIGISHSTFYEWYKHYQECGYEGMAPQHRIYHRPRLLSDNGSCFISMELKDYLSRYEMKHIRTRTYHPKPQGKIERYHRFMKTSSCCIIIIHGRA